MAIVRPFRAIRPGKEYAEKVISLPYDVMNRKEAAEMAGENPYSFLRICRSEIDMPQQENPYDPSIYEKAKENIADFLNKGVFLREETPSFYIYRQTMDGRTQTGIAACVSVNEYQNDTIKKHEFTRVDKEIDRINHFDICNTNTEPVFLTYRENAKINTIVKEWTEKYPEEYSFTNNDGIGHTLWTVSDEKTVSEISASFGDIPALYIADGHHRSASACKVGLKRREEKSNYTGEEEFNFFMAVIFPDTELKIFDYNRVVKDLNQNTAEEFIKKVELAGFEVVKMGGDIYTPEAKHIFAMYLEGNWYKITTKEILIPDDIIGALDVSILQNNLLKPILGIEDPRTDKRIDFVGGIRGLAELEKRVNTDMAVAFAVYPVEISDLLNVSDNDMVMPPKSTWFEPKLGSGLFLHEL